MPWALGGDRLAQAVAVKAPVNYDTKSSFLSHFLCPRSFSARKLAWPGQIFYRDKVAAQAGHQFSTLSSLFPCAAPGLGVSHSLPSSFLSPACGFLCPVIMLPPPPSSLLFRVAVRINYIWARNKKRKMGMAGWVLSSARMSSGRLSTFFFCDIPLLCPIVSHALFMTSVGGRSVERWVEKKREEDSPEETVLHNFRFPTKKREDKGNPPLFAPPLPSSPRAKTVSIFFPLRPCVRGTVGSQKSRPLLTLIFISRWSGIFCPVSWMGGG